MQNAPLDITMDAEALDDRSTALGASLADAENWLALGAGALLLLVGASRRSAVGACLAVSSAPLLYRGITAVGPTFSMAMPSPTSTRTALGGERGVHVRESVRLEVPVADVYRFWRRLENLPRFMTHLDRVTETPDGRSHWVAAGPAGLAVEWDAEIINEVENKVLAWRSLPGSDVVDGGIGELRRGARRPEHPGQRAPAVRATGRKGGRARRVALRSRALSDHPRGSPALQAAARSR